jgi:hypothetical protein
MYRWIIGGLLLALLLVIILSGRGANKTSYVNGLALYTQIPGREFIFQRDCYIFKLKNSDSDWPYVASHASVPALPIDVDLKNVGVESPDLRILDIVTTGTRFRIVSVRRDQRGEKATITYEILLADEASRKYPRVDALFMLDHTAENTTTQPMIVPEFAVPRRTE